MIRIFTKRFIQVNNNLFLTKFNNKTPLIFNSIIKNNSKTSLLQFYSTLPNSKPNENITTSLNSNSTTSKDETSSNKIIEKKQVVIEEGVTSRLKQLFRTNGWSALVIYLALSLADFSLTFLLIYAVGAEKVREAEDWVLETLGWRRKDGEPGKVKRAVTEWKENHNVGATTKSNEDQQIKPVPIASTTTTTTTTTSKDDSGYSAIATTAVLAYAIHKTLLLPVRLGITVAITPRIVRTLQAWGWKVGYAGVVGAGTGTAASSSVAAGGGASGGASI